MTGFTFGSASTSAASTPSLFGSTNATTNLFGNKAGTPASSLFGSTTTSTPSTLSLFGNAAPLSTPASTTGGLFANLGKTATSTTTTPSLFGGTATATPALSGGLFNNLGKPATTSTTPSLFGGTLSTTPAPSAGLFKLGATPAVAASTTPNLFGATTSMTPNTGSLFNTTTVAALPTTKEETVTLGGIRSDNSKTTGPKAWRNETVPAPVCKLVDEFKKFLKEQKDLKDEISRFSPASIDKVKEEIEYLIKNVRYLSHSVSTDSSAIAALKNSVITELKNCEIAQRTRDSTNLPLEISLPMEYFYKLVNQFEEAIQMYKIQIDEIESVMSCESNIVNSSNIGAMLNRMHQIFVALASKLHTLHEDIKLQKDFYLNYRKVIYKDDTNIFEVRRKGRMVSQVCPTPFSDTTNTLTASFHKLSSANMVLPITTMSAPAANTSLFSNTHNTTSNLGLGLSSSFATPILGIKKKR